MPRDDINIRFCALMLRMTMRDLTTNEAADFRKNQGTLCSEARPGRRQYLVEWPKMSKDGRTFAWEGHADNANDAKAKALQNWLEHHSPQVRARKLVEGYHEDPVT